LVAFKGVEQEILWLVRQSLFGYSAFIQNGAAANHATQATSKIVLTGSSEMTPNIYNMGGTMVASNDK
jgi:gamma-glutamyl-gamma-aminobutyrate hydrolase PuuD